jgi:threonine/homoserine/homoserine lactone efflux protein
VARESINVNINQGPTLGGAMLTVLVFIALFLAYWKAVLSVVSVLAIAALCWFAWRAWRETVDSQIRHNAKLAADADAQHNWVMRGDPRGTYGADMWRGLSVNDFRSTHGKEPGS